MSRALQIFAGHRALEKIKREGIQPEQIEMILGASGGPKWFILSQLDQFLNADFLKQASQPIQLIGSSVGAWRMACYAQKDPVAAIKRLEDLYLNQTYSDQPPVSEVTSKAITILDSVVPESELHHILSNTNRHLHAVAARCHGWTESESTGRQFAGMVASAAVNLISRRGLSHFYERVVFSQNPDLSPFRSLEGVSGRISFLNQMNLKKALLATGAIPLVLEGVMDIPGAPAGVYRDGGLVDYHFDIPLKTHNGIILYPHFAPVLKPGWLDKSIPWRGVHPDNYADVVLLTPTESFIKHLPYGKIPDRKDFQKLNDNARIHYWRNCISLGERLVYDFKDLVNSDRLALEVKPLEPSKLKAMKQKS